MRMMGKGSRFMEVEADFSPDGWDHPYCPPTFSEAFLYDTVGKGDARFILGVAEEYTHLIELFGEKLTGRLLAARCSKGDRAAIRRGLQGLLDEHTVATR